MRDCVKPSPDLAMIAKHICDNHGYKRKGKAEEKKHKPQGYGGKGHGGNPRKIPPLCPIKDKTHQRGSAGCHFPFPPFLTSSQLSPGGQLPKQTLLSRFPPTPSP